MTSHKKSHNSNSIREQDIVLWVNITMIGMAILLLFYYVMMANTVTAKSYKIQTLRDKIDALAETNGVLMSKKIAMESPTALLDFAKSRSLVEAKNIVYIFENRNVAQKW